jgi:hypothetical protein
MNPDLFFDYIERATTELEARTEQCKRETASLVRGTHAGSTTLSAFIYSIERFGWQRAWFIEA